MKSNPPNAPWRCPICNRRFARRNQTHSCAQLSVRDHLKGRSRELRTLYKRLEGAIRRAGKSDLVVTKSRIGFQSRVVFAAVTVRTDSLVLEFSLARELKDRRFRRIDPISNHHFLHVLRIDGVGDIDPQLSRWIKEAYLMGSQTHLRRVV